MAGSPIARLAFSRNEETRDRLYLTFDAQTKKAFVTLPQHSSISLIFIFEIQALAIDDLFQRICSVSISSPYVPKRKHDQTAIPLFAEKSFAFDKRLMDSLCHGPYFVGTGETTATLGFSKSLVANDQTSQRAQALRQL